MAARASMKESLSGRLANFDLIRIVAATFVVIGHSFPLTGNSGAPSFLGMGLHTLGVKIFFCVSGYLVLDSWLRDAHLARFAARRMLRILPALALVVAACAIVFGPLMSTQSLSAYVSDPAFANYFDNIALYIRYYLPGVFVGNPVGAAVNGSLWTLPVEAAAYAFVPVLFWRPHMRLTTGLTALFCVFAISADLALSTWFPGTRLVFYATDWRAGVSLFPYFFIGAWVRAAVQQRRFDIRLVGLCIVAVAVFPAGSLPWSLLPYVIIPVLTFAVAFGPTIFPLKGTDISYGVYLWSFPVAQALVSLKLALLPWPNAALTLLIVVPFASASWFFVERPFLRLKPAKLCGAEK